MSFLVYDLVLLGIFIIVLGIFLFRRRKYVKKEGLLLLYRAKWGINLIHKVGKKHAKLLNVLSYVSVTLGYLLMTGVLYMVGKIVWIYVSQGAIVRAIKIPPITPLIPYLPQIFKLNFLPPFYFTYWIIIIAIVAIVHEFAHGIFAAKSKVKIKNTGFGFFPFFLPIFLAAFVEMDEKKMSKKKKFDQLAVLSAGTFANTVTAIVFTGIMALFFSLAFAPSGVVFDSYPYAVVNTSSISMVNGIQIHNATYSVVTDLMNKTGFSIIQSDSVNFTATKDYVTKQNATPDELLLYFDAPAIRANLESTITRINDVQVSSPELLSSELHKYSPGQSINITTLGTDNLLHTQIIVLGQSPENASQSWLGVGFLRSQQTGGLMGWFYSFFSLNRNHVYYASQIGDMGIFIYNLLWWLVIINISVALINMLPMGIFDGGRFFYVTVWAITKNEKAAKIAFKAATYFFLLVLAVVMFFWFLYVR